jgi:hypothetical protein
MHKRWHRTLPLIAVIAAVATIGCVPRYGFGGDTAEKITVYFTDRCEAVYAGGEPVEEFHVKTWEQITFCNRGDKIAIVVFEEGRSWIGRDSIRLYPGECVTLRVRIATPGEYSYKLYCTSGKGDEEAGEGGGPILKDPPGGGGG